MIYVEILMIMMAIWVIPMSYGDEAKVLSIGDVADPPRTGDGSNGVDPGWYDARATFYGGSRGEGTENAACGYGDPRKQGYGLATTALSTPLFNDGYTCGACYELKCVHHPRCLPGTIKVTATNFCPPGSEGGWCNPPQRHFDLSQPMFLKIAPYIVGVVPIQYRRVLCAKAGGVKFETKGNPNFLMILAYNVGGAGDIKAMQIKGSRTGWIPMKRNWGQNWTTNVVLTGQALSLRITTSDGITKDFINVMPPNWGFGQTFDGKINF